MSTTRPLRSQYISMPMTPLRQTYSPVSTKKGSSCTPTRATKEASRFWKKGRSLTSSANMTPHSSCLSVLDTSESTW